MVGRVVLAALLLMALFIWAEALVGGDPEAALAASERQNIELRQQIAALEADLVSCRSVCRLHTPSENAVGLNPPHRTPVVGLPPTKPGTCAWSQHDWLAPSHDCILEPCRSGVVVADG